MKNIIKIGFICAFSVLFLLQNITKAATRNLPGVKIITRSERGADESIRMLNYNPKKTNTSTENMTKSQKEAARKSKIRNNWMAKNYPNDRKYAESQNTQGNYFLLYPNYWNHNKTKIMIHHTAMNYEPSWGIDDVKKQLQYIYKYHTKDRDFGDIGYNFIIDQMGNIYEGRSGGEGAIGMHTANNNASSIGIALMGNFENTYPTNEQLSALVNLLTALSTYYKIDPYAYTHTFYLTDTDPYVAAKKNLQLMGHKDAGNTACPGKNLYSLLPAIRKEVFYRRQNKVIGEQPLPFDNHGKSITKKSTTEINKETQGINENLSKQKKVNEIIETIKSSGNNDGNSNFSERFLNIKNNKKSLYNNLKDGIRTIYGIKESSNLAKVSKISKRITIDEVKDLLKKDISVLLYELTTKFETYEIKCSEECLINIDGKVIRDSNVKITKLGNNYMVKTNRGYPGNVIEIKSTQKDGIVEIKNYERKSYVGIPWNIFKGSLKFTTGKYPKSVNGEQQSGFIVTNTLPFEEYMKGIVETNDTETLEKNKVMAMVTKNYALFYLNGKNQHPNIEKGQEYQAIDDANFYQKYVGAGLEKTLKKWYQALDETKNEIIMYDGFLPILPYFNCSIGVTYSAEEKRGWNDTPYLQSVIDIETCDSFKGHGVGLAGQGAEWFAKKGMQYTEILKYFYSGIEIKNIN